MSDESKENPQESRTSGVDLSSLSDLNFGPNWAGDKGGSKGRYQDYEAEGPKWGDRRKRGGSGGRDRRAGGRPQRSGGAGHDSRGEASRGDRGQEGSGDRPRFNRRDDRRGSRQRDMAPPFEPTVQVDLYPQDEAFDALVGRLTATARTYQLFEIARLILEKPDRYIVVIANKAKDGNEAAPLFFAVPGHLPFETEEAAINHVLSHHLDHFFTIETVEMEAPKGNFQVVNRCSMTGELLGPPNYHRYQEFVQRHYNNRIQNMSFERFQSKIETVKEQESIDAWMESMKQGERYLLKERAEGEPESFSTLEEVRLFLIQHRKDKVVSSAKSVRFAGRDIERMPRGDLRRSVEVYCEQQKRFPLDTANNLRGRLRRHNFAVYKRGSKGVSFVCSVKRKFRDESTVFSDSIQELITFIEANQEILSTQLPKAYLGIDAEKIAAEKPKPAAAEAAPETSAETAAPAVEVTEPVAVVEADGAEVTPADTAEAETPANEVAEAPISTEATEITEATEEAAAEPVAETTPVEETAAALTDDEKSRLNTLFSDLRWLVREGYVTEYGDGRLFASPILPKAKPKPKAVPVAAKAEVPAAEEAEAATDLAAEAADEATVAEAVAPAVDSGVTEEVSSEAAEVADAPAEAEAETATEASPAEAEAEETDASAETEVEPESPERDTATDS
ncbi:MAG: hypothetical protein ACON39_07540 [Coraliomargaritaceae bacterium]